MTRGGLRIAQELQLPLEAVSQTFAVLAKRGAGKTYTVLVIVEEMLKAGLQVVVADPVGVTWGLRASADGKHAGLPIVVLGGDHGDLPLDVAGGQLIADLVVDEQLSAVLDLSRFRKGEQVRFMTDFAEQLYHRNRNPLHLILDEADAFAPQRPLPGQQRMLGAVEDIVRRGRARGLGVSLVTQRSAVLNKDVLTQVEVLVALRTIAPQDRAAIDEWIKVHGTPAQREQLMSSLPSLPIGTAWFWSPGWLDLFQQVQVRKRETFDSSATPKVGQKLQAPRQLADVDLEALRRRLASTIEKAKADDPRELRKRIAELERQVAERPTVEKVVEKVVQVPVISAAIHKALDDLRLAAASAESVLHQAIAASDVQRDAAFMQQVTPPSKTPVPRIDPVPVEHHRPPPHSLAPRPEHSTPNTGTAGTTAPQQRVLDALASFEAAGLVDVAKSNAAVFAGQSSTSSGFANNLGALRSRGLITYPSGGRVALTDAGRAGAAPTERIRSIEQLHEAWRVKLSAPQWRILDTLLKCHPDAMARDELAVAARQSPTSSGFANNLGALRSLGLLDYPRSGMVAATELLFPALPDQSP